MHDTAYNAIHQIIIHLTAYAVEQPGFDHGDHIHANGHAIVTGYSPTGLIGSSAH